MAVSRFDKPTSQPLINTYVPIPFQELLQAGMAKQERYDTNLSLVDAYSDNILKMKALPVDRPLLQQKQQEFQETVEPYITSDLSDPTVTRRLQQDLRRIARDPILQNINASYQRYQEGLQSARERYEKGDLSAPSQRWFMLDSPYSDYASAGGAASGNVYNYNPVAKYVDIEGELADKYLKMPIQKLMEVGRQWGINYITKETIEQRRPEIISQLVQAELQANPVYREQLRVDAMYNSAQTGIDPNEYLSSVIGTMGNRVGNYVGVNNRSLDVRPDPTNIQLQRLAAARKAAETPVSTSLVTPLIGMNVEPSANRETILDAITKKPRYLGVDPRISFGATPLTRGVRGQEGTEGLGSRERREPSYSLESLNAIQRGGIERILSIVDPNINVDDVFRNPDKYQEELNEARNYIEDNTAEFDQIINPYGILFDKDQQEMMNRIWGGDEALVFDEEKGIAGNLVHQQFIDPTTGEIIRGIDLQEYLKDEGIEEGRVSFSSKPSPRNPFAFVDSRFGNSLGVVVAGSGKVKPLYMTDVQNLSREVLSNISQGLEYTQQQNPLIDSPSLDELGY